MHHFNAKNLKTLLMFPFESRFKTRSLGSYLAENESP